MSREARLVTDDMATVVLTPTAGVTAGGFRSEQIEIDAAEAGDGIAEQLPRGVRRRRRAGAAVRRAEVAALCQTHGGAVMHVRFGMRGPQVEVLPRNVESFEARVSAAQPPPSMAPDFWRTRALRPYARRGHGTSRR